MNTSDPSSWRSSFAAARAIRTGTPSTPGRPSAARLEGKLDAALATHTATLAEHARRLDVHDTRLNAHASTLTEHTTQIAAIPPPAPRMAAWQIVGVVIAGLAVVTTVFVAMADRIVGLLIGI
ncbi:hypothetical protein OEB99_17900 [Actinotalea sp. M2MS4P-6]|uniref:hypothetical protein n=1 Tax=Actinotalea sp. M2MS4P-6 TaxID=2983762 RepID=UPI0021E477EA|nr:hypothetical protein [Actinotalea sp. M2MS4P-6]MCV2396188.1 hypothetical protein [Actinotalea sp. M2MS4P-6]